MGEISKINEATASQWGDRRHDNTVSSYNSRSEQIIKIACSVDNAFIWTDAHQSSGVSEVRNAFRVQNDCGAFNTTVTPTAADIKRGGYTFICLESSISSP